MPYISRRQRYQLDPAIYLLVKSLKAQQGESLGMAGPLNYVITRILRETLLADPSYLTIALITGVLETCKLEMYRRLAAPYEDEKALENGDVYQTY